jgi:hypothetical protein
MAQDKVIIRRSGHQALDELDATDIPALAYEATGAITTHAGAADPHGDRSFATSAIATHAGLSDPHPTYLTAAEGAAAYTAIGAYAPGGTDVAVADGGTGSSTAAAARTALGVGSTGRLGYGGNIGYQVPGIAITATSAVALAINTLRYAIFWTPTTVVIDQVAVVVTTGPATNANVRVGIYAGVDGQPSGNPLADVTVAVASAFTGTKTIAASATVTGQFLVALNCDVTMSLRTWRGTPTGGFIDSGLGTSSQISEGTIASTYGTMPTPGTAWTAIGSLVEHLVVVRVLTP